MKIQSDSARTKRRALGKKVLRFSIRAVLFFLAAAAITGTIAISLNLRLQEWERTHPHSHHLD